VKNWFQSKTVWVNIAVVLLAIQQAMPQVQSFVDPKVYAVILGVIGFINIILRAVTSKGIKA